MTKRSALIIVEWITSIGKPIRKSRDNQLRYVTFFSATLLKRQYSEIRRRGAVKRLLEQVPSTVQ